MPEHASPTESPSTSPPVAMTGRSRRRRWLIGVVLLVSAVLIHRYAWPKAWNASARQCISRHREELALNQLWWADALGSRHPETALLRIQALRRSGAIQDLEMAIREAAGRGVDPDRLERERILLDAQSGRLRAALPHLARLLQDYRGDNRDVCQAYITGFLLNQRIPEAIQLLNAWMADAPDDGYPFLIHARIARLRSESTQEEEDLREAIRRTPELAEARIELAELLQENHRADEAAELFRSLQKDPEFRTRATIGLATCLKSLGNAAECLQLLQQAVAENPKSFTARVELGRAQMEAGEYAAAESLLQAASDERPFDDEARYLLAQSLQMQGRDAAAEDHFAFVKRARDAHAELLKLKDEIQQDPRNTDLYVRTGQLLLEFGEPDEGVITLQAALDLDPRCDAAHAALAEYYESRAGADPELKSRAAWHREQLSEEPQANP